VTDFNDFPDFNDEAAAEPARQPGAAESEGPRSPRQLWALGIGAVVLVAAIVGVAMLSGDDGPDQVSTGTDPAVAVTDSTAEEPTESDVDAGAGTAVVEPAPDTEVVPVETDVGAEAEPETSIETVPETAADTEAAATTEAGSAAPATEAPPVAEEAATTTAVPPPPPAADTATYRVTLVGNWVAATHPTTLPGNAHFSDPVIAVHGAPGAMFTVGQNASPGIEEMAEVGRTSTLLGELGAMPGVIFADVASGIDAPATSDRSFDITVTQAAPLVSLVTMLAPSPDWFVGFADQTVFVDGQWIDGVAFDLGNYDAGTDSGPGFSSDNAATSPAAPVDGPRDDAFAAAAAEGVFGTVTITKTG